MLKYRLIFGPLMVAALVVLFFLDNRLDELDITGTIWQRIFLGRTYLPAGLLMLAALFVLIPLATRELCAIFRATGIPADPIMIAASSMIGCSMIYIMPSRIDSQRSVAILATLVALVFLIALVKHSWQGRTRGAVAVGGAAMFALIYMGLLPGFFILIRRWHSAWMIAGIILITKSCDIGAYFTGRAIGRHKLIVWLSPGKTWEGLIGGVVLSTLTAVALCVLGDHLGVTGHFNLGRSFVPEHYPLWGTAVAGALMGVIGQFGDLCASLFKRDAGLKDSGTAIPGFGGLLDVMDSPLVVAPLAYWLLTALSKLP